jgi:hypothetical protein
MIVVLALDPCPVTLDAPRNVTSSKKQAVFGDPLTSSEEQALFCSRVQYAP